MALQSVGSSESAGRLRPILSTILASAFLYSFHIRHRTVPASTRNSIEIVIDCVGQRQLRQLRQLRR